MDVWSGLEYYCRKSGQIPAFGDWDHANELPITQYFECARQAGLLRFSSSSGESDRARKSGDLYAVAAADDEHKFSRSVAPHKKARTREKRNGQLKEQRKTGRVICEMKEPPRKQHLTSRSQHNAHHHHHHDRLELPTKSKPSKPKAVDEDLYKIPPHLLHTTKRKKVLGFFSRCLVPACTA
ncbi:uncharacterized protein LOC115693062 isoform X1 [Syzygium oleosum]|uniref:uncharacterized protein LOC115693062 isoform X1 n=1 Tax=Syzygium oleosum TaxID=219896 RepID=UPI0011D1B006|nr:uncharacterized protein LOC115693062 isoform X1 [Syzygium oleosum]